MADCLSSLIWRAARLYSGIKKSCTSQDANFIALELKTRGFGVALKSIGDVAKDLPDAVEDSSSSSEEE